MTVTEWWELRGGFIVNDVVRWKDPLWATVPEKDRKQGERGGSFGGHRFVKTGLRLIVAEVIDGPDEDGWVWLRVIGWDNLGPAPIDKIFAAPPVGKKIRRKARTILRGDPERLPWEKEGLREQLVSEVWGDDEALRWNSASADEYEDVET